MNKILLFALASFVQLSVAHSFEVTLNPRIPAKDDADQNEWVLAINGKTKLQYEEMQAFTSCVGQLRDLIPLVNQTIGMSKYPSKEAEAKAHTEKILKLTETPSIKVLYTVMKNKTCLMYKTPKKDLILTTPTKVGLEEFVEGPLQECLMMQLDTTPVEGARPRFSIGTPKTPEQIKQAEHDKHCPDAEADNYKEDEDGNEI